MLDLSLITEVIICFNNMLDMSSYPQLLLAVGFKLFNYCCTGLFSLTYGFVYV